MAPSKVGVKVGVLAIQGSVSEHLSVVKEVLRDRGVEGEVVGVKKPIQLEGVDGLIIPGGESTTIGLVSGQTRLLQAIIDRAKEGMPVMGTCAGLIMLAKEVIDIKVGETSQPLLGLMDIRVTRNAYGRQRESFEAELKIPPVTKKLFRGVFIRAPHVERVWGETRALATYEGKIVAVEEGNLLGTTFHPELSGSLAFHRYFLEKILRAKEALSMDSVSE